MPKANADYFPAHGNHHGKTAGVKIDFAYDLLTGNIIAHSLEQATMQDKSIGKEAIAELKPGSLVLRDMGYCPLKDQLNSSTRLWLRFLGPLHCF